MTRLIPEKLHVKYLSGATADAPVAPWFYTLTHSDSTGDLFLSIGSDYDKKQISGLYTRLMRDEVLAELRKDSEGFSLNVYCHVSGGFVFGSYGLFVNHFFPRDFETDFLIQPPGFRHVLVVHS